MRTTKTLRAACRLLKKRVRYENAGLTLGDDESISQTKQDTRKIQRATKLYVDSWIVPIIEAIEKGDTAALQRMLR